MLYQKQDSENGIKIGEKSEMATLEYCDSLGSFSKQFLLGDK